MQPRAHLDAEGLHCIANRHGAADRSLRAVEHREEAVTRGAHLAASEAIELHADDGVVRVEQRMPVTVTHLCSTPRRVDDVGENVVSDVTEGDPGNDERLAFVYNSDRVQPSGLVGELVLPEEAGNPVRQFARSPYAAAFVRGKTEFILTTVHVLWANPAQRLPEITAFAEWMEAWAKRKSDWNTNLIVLGDFNLDRIGNPLYEAFVSTGLYPPAELNDIPRTIFDDDQSKHFYDQIAWFSTPAGTQLLESLTYTKRAGSFDFVPHCYPQLTKAEMSFRISDHYPLWAEFKVG